MTKLEAVARAIASDTRDPEGDCWELFRADARRAIRAARSWDRGATR